MVSATHAFLPLPHYPTFRTARFALYRTALRLYAFFLLPRTTTPGFGFSRTRTPPALCAFYFGTALCTLFEHTFWLPPHGFTLHACTHTATLRHVFTFASFCALCTFAFAHALLCTRFAENAHFTTAQHALHTPLLQFRLTPFRFWFLAFSPHTLRAHARILPGFAPPTHLPWFLPLPTYLPFLPVRSGLPPRIFLFAAAFPRTHARTHLCRALPHATTARAAPAPAFAVHARLHYTPHRTTPRFAHFPTHLHACTRFARAAATHLHCAGSGALPPLPHAARTRALCTHFAHALRAHFARTPRALWRARRTVCRRTARARTLRGARTRARRARLPRTRLDGSCRAFLRALLHHAWLRRFAHPTRSFMVPFARAHARACCCRACRAAARSRSAAHTTTCRAPRRRRAPRRHAPRSSPPRCARAALCSARARLLPAGLARARALRTRAGGFAAHASFCALQFVLALHFLPLPLHFAAPHFAVERNGLQPAGFCTPPPRHVLPFCRHFIARALRHLALVAVCFARHTGTRTARTRAHAHAACAFAAFCVCGARFAARARMVAHAPPARVSAPPPHARARHGARARAARSPHHAPHLPRHFCCRTRPPHGHGSKVHVAAPRAAARFAYAHFCARAHAHALPRILPRATPRFSRLPPAAFAGAAAHAPTPPVCRTTTTHFTLPVAGVRSARTHTPRRTGLRARAHILRAHFAAHSTTTYRFCLRARARTLRHFVFVAALHAAPRTQRRRHGSFLPRGGGARACLPHARAHAPFRRTRAPRTRRAFCRTRALPPRLVPRCRARTRFAFGVLPPPAAYHLPAGARAAGGAHRRWFLRPPPRWPRAPRTPHRHHHARTHAHRVCSARAAARRARARCRTHLPRRAGRRAPLRAATTPTHHHHRATTAAPPLPHARRATTTRAAWFMVPAAHLPARLYLPTPLPRPVRPTCTLPCLPTYLPTQFLPTPPTYLPTPPAVLRLPPVLPSSTYHLPAPGAGCPRCRSSQFCRSMVPSSMVRSHTACRAPAPLPRLYPARACRLRAPARICRAATYHLHLCRGVLPFVAARSCLPAAYLPAAACRSMVRSTFAAVAGWFLFPGAAMVRSLPFALPVLVRSSVGSQLMVAVGYLPFYPRLVR